MLKAKGKEMLLYVETETECQYFGKKGSVRIAISIFALYSKKKN